MNRRWWLACVTVLAMVLIAPRARADEPRALTPQGLENVAAAAKLFGYVRFFHPSDQAVGVKNWAAVAIDLLEAAEPATNADDLAARLTKAVAPLAPSIQIWAGGPDHAPALPPKPLEPTGTVLWRHNGAGSISESTVNIYKSDLFTQPFAATPTDESYAGCFAIKPLGGGVTCRVPIKLYRDDAGTLPHADPTPEKFAKPANNTRYSATDRSTRLAGVMIAWTVMQHFYPYFDVVKTDWPAALTDALKAAAEDRDEKQFHFTLRALIAKLNDGHGSVYHPSLETQTMLPVSVTWAGDDLVVIAVLREWSDQIKVGDVLVSIDGRPSEQCYARVSEWISAASDGWRRHASMQGLVANMPTTDPVPLALRRPNGEVYGVTVPRTNTKLLIKDKAFLKRPEQGAEVAPGIVYFDLNGANNAAFQKALPAITAAKGLIFDLRGYPNDAATTLLPMLSDEPLQSARWNVPIVTKPDGEGWTWSTSGRWNLPPKQPRLTQPVAFLTGGGAISYAESVMGIVEHYKLGEIVGAPTAGTNGNVNPFTLPGGYLISWTGMKVLKHDGSQHHGVGIKPTVPIEPTAKGIAEGRDEVLEKGIEVVKAKIKPE